MNTTHIRRRSVVALAAVLLTGGAALGLAGCQTSPAAQAPASTVFDERSADRIAAEIAREVALGHLPTRNCVHHRVIEHPDGGWHLTCVQRVGQTRNGWTPLTRLAR